MQQQTMGVPVIDPLRIVGVPVDDPNQTYLGDLLDWGFADTIQLGRNGACQSQRGADL